MEFNIYGKPNALPSYNEYINQCKNNRFGASVWKKKWQKHIVSQIKSEEYYNEPFYMNLIICESSKRRDKDNVESMAKKLILDTLQEYGYISNDKLYDGGTTKFLYGKESYINVKIGGIKDV